MALKEKTEKEIVQYNLELKVLMYLTMGSCFFLLLAGILIFSIDFIVRS